MLIHISPSMRRITISSSNGFLDFNKVKGAALQLGKKKIGIFTVIFGCMILFFLYIFIAINALEAGRSIECVGTFDCLGRRFGPRFFSGRRGAESELQDLAARFSKLLLQVKSEALPEGLVVPDSFNGLLADIKGNSYDINRIVFKIKAMLEQLEEKARRAKLQEYVYRHFAASGIPKGMHCLSLTLADEYTSNAHARIQLPSPELVPRLMDDSYHHFVVATDNVLAASVVVSSTVKNSANPEKVVFHVITDRKTYAAMHAWFALHPLHPAIIEVKNVNQFDWLRRDNIPVLKAMDSQLDIQKYYHGDHATGADLNDSPRILAAKLQARSPKYISIMNHLRIYLPELFPTLNKVVFLDDDVVVQRDLSPLWEIDLQGKVNGAVETCSSIDPAIKPKTFQTYLNFSHPLISTNFNRDQCAWAYGMNIFDLQAWRRTNIKEIYHYWLRQNLKSKLNLWHLGTLPPALIAFNGNVRAIDPSWHMLGLGYEPNCSRDIIRKAAVIHYNGQAKPWLDIGFSHLKTLWTRYVDYNDEFIANCNIMET